jgi:hypothetical protein
MFLEKTVYFRKKHDKKHEHKDAALLLFASFVRICRRKGSEMTLKLNYYPVSLKNSK